MDQLKEYKKIVKIQCLSIPQTNNNTYTFQVKFQQINPHNLFKFLINKTKQELIRLYQQLQQQIFDFDNPFSQHFFNNLTKAHLKPLQEINESLVECTERLDILTHHYFISFFSIHVHYPDFVACLQQETINKEQVNVNTVKQEIVKPWLKDYKDKNINEKEKTTLSMQKIKTKEQPIFQQMIKMIRQDQQYKIQSQQKSIIDFIPVNDYQHEFIIVLQQCKKTTKITNYFKSLFTEPKAFGFISIHRKQNKQYKIKCKIDLQAEPKSLEYNRKTNMVMVLTTVGIFVYLIKMSIKSQIFQVFAFIELVDTIAFANNCFLAEIYLIRNLAPYKLYVYSLKQQKLMQTQYKYKNAESICFEQTNNRLFVSDKTGIYIYLVNGGLDIKRMHFLKTDQSYINLSQKLGYLYCINLTGILTVIEIKPIQKEQLMSITTTISIPTNNHKIVGSKNPRIIISNYRNCIVLIDTKEGPINSYKLKQSSDIQSVYYHKENQSLMAMTADGLLTVMKISKRIQ